MPGEHSFPWLLVPLASRGPSRANVGYEVDIAVAEFDALAIDQHAMALALRVHAVPRQRTMINTSPLQ